MIMPVTSAEYLAKPACAPIATDRSAIPTTSMLTPLSSEARGQVSAFFLGDVMGKRV